MSYGRLIVDWKGLKELGWPLSKAQTWRMMKPTVFRTKGLRRKGTYREWHEPNERPFPKCHKLGKFRNSPPVWFLAEVIEYLKPPTTK